MSHAINDLLLVSMIEGLKNNDVLTKSMYSVLDLFRKSNQIKELSPKDADKKLKVGLYEVINLFLELELQNFVEWVSLDLLELDLERSNSEIYNEVYHSNARLTTQGENLIKEYNSLE